MAASTKQTGKVVVLYNGRGASPKVEQGGLMAKKKGGRGRGTAAKSSGATSSKRRGRRRAASAPRTYYAQSNSSRRGRKSAKASRGRKHYRRNSGVVGSVSNLVGQLFFGGIGAFAASTASLLNPIQPASAVVATLLDLAIALGVAWAGGKVFPKHRDTIRIGAFAFVAGNIVTRVAPNLQQQIVSLSPVKAPQQLTAGDAGPIDDTIADVSEVGGWGGFGDVNQVTEAGGQYM